MLGVCYYPEHWPEARWAEDARLMRECGLQIVRIGEFAWSRIEPHENTCDWNWLDRAIDTLAAAGLKIMLGTPTATPPAWLTQRHPDVLRVGADGRRWSHGGRRHTCPSSATYREYCTKIVQALSQRYGNHPAVVAWQIDNELSNHGTGRCACDDCRAAFQSWCRARYTTLDRLNAAWGTVFWSQHYTDWAQIPLPSDPAGGGHNPSLQLAYRRWASDAHVDFVRQQAAILHENSPGRPITTNIAPLDDEIDWHAIAAEVDVISWDNYPHGFEHPADVAFFHDLVRGMKRRPFWVTEQQAGPINWTAYNPLVPPGQVRLWTYQALAHGAEHVLFFRWRASRYGQEQYHSGLLNHDASRAQGFVEAQQTAHELAEHGPIERAPADVALLVSYPDLWAVQIEPHNRAFDYWGMARAIYRDFWQRGINVDIIARGQDISRYRQVIPIAPLLIDATEAEQWRNFVQNGGQLSLTIRSFAKDQENVWTDQPMPAGLTDLVRAQAVEWLSLPPHMRAAFRDSNGTPFDVPLWVERLATDSAQSPVAYVPHSLPGIADVTAVIERSIGSHGGKARYVGVYPPAPEVGLWSGTQTASEEATIETIKITSGWLHLNHSVEGSAVLSQPVPPLQVLLHHEGAVRQNFVDASGEQ